MKKNSFEIIKNGNVMTVKVMATSEAMADRFFEMFEALGIQAVKINLEKEWR